MMTILLAMMFNVVLVIVCAFALIRGGTPERIGALVNLAASVATGLLEGTHLVSQAPAAIATLAIDMGTTAAFFWLAIRTTRFWPVWAFGFALANLLVSVAGVLLPHILLFIYHTGLVIYAYLALGVLTLGTYRLPRDADPVVRNGFRTPWRTRRPETS